MSQFPIVPESNNMPAKRPSEPVSFRGELEPTMAQAITRLAEAVETHTQVSRPAMEAIGSIAERADKLCAFLRKKGPWLLASVPAVLVAIGAITPNVAGALKTFFQALGAG